MTGLAPGFDPANKVYEVIAGDSGTATVTPTVASIGATPVVKVGSTTYPLSNGAASVPITRNRNDIAVVVTSPDASASMTYRVTVWRLAAPTSQVVGLADSTSTVFGGVRTTVTLADGGLPSGCSRSYTIGGRNSYLNSGTRTYDPASGLTTEVLDIPRAEDHRPGHVDLVVTNSCSLPGGGGAQATTTVPGAITYLAGYPVQRADVPARVTAGSRITVYGPGVNEYTDDVYYWIDNAQGQSQKLDDWDWTGNDNDKLYVDYDSGNDWYRGSGPRTLHAGYCFDRPRDNDFSGCTSTFSQTVNWVAPVPYGVTFTPASGPVSGGTTIRIKGRLVLSGAGNTVVKVGDQAVSYNYVYGAEEEEGTFDEYTQDQDIIEITTPPATTPGPVPITVTTDYGTTTAAGTFTYAARPAITSVSPSSVANTGGSVITLQGTDFGTAGRPTVIIGGVKSPSVTRISATRLTAVVPPSSATGPVDVTVASPQGGGVSLAASLTLTAPGTLPVISRLSVASGHAGDEVTITGTGFGAPGTAGVSVDGVWARVTANSATSITFEVPPTDTAGLKDLMVAATTGTVTRSGGFTVLPDAAITSVSPTSIPSYATGSAAAVTLQGAGFGTTGTVKVGAAAAVAYTATASGTRIAGVVVPTTTAGSLPIVVTPAGATTSLRSSVFVNGPSITYAGSDPHRSVYENPNVDSGETGFVLSVPTTGGIRMRVEGTGFGTGGVLKLGGTTVSTTSWTDTAITFAAPAHTAGTVPLTVMPTRSSLTATRAVAANYLAVEGQPAIGRIASVVDHSYSERNDFDPVADVSNAFTLTGVNLAGTAPAATRVVVDDGSQTFTIVPTGVSATSLTFAAPRGFTGGGWKTVTVTTGMGADLVTLGLNYLTAGVTLTRSPNDGLCLRAATSGYTPAVVTISNSGGLFGSAGAVKIDGVAVTPTTYNDGQVVFTMAGLATDLPNPWGGKAIVITPADTTKPAQSVGFTCGVTPAVATTANGSTTALSVAAGTSYSVGNAATGFIGTNGFAATAPAGYEYVTAADFGSTGFDRNVRAGAPVAAGAYYVRVALSRATYAREKYLPFSPAPVHVTITGTPITITPTSTGGSTIVYKGQLTDRDLTYTPSSTTDPITRVVWEYRDTVCAGQGATAGWTEGLPRNVAVSSTACGGDGVTPSGWEVRVKSFEMTTGGTDRSIYYAATRPSTTVTITPRPLTPHPGRADKVYDGTTTAVIGDLTFTGVVPGDDITLTNGAGGGTFADPSPGVNKPVTLSSDIVLAGAAATNYTLTNPRPTVAGTITKASAMLSLAASTTSVLLSQNTPVTVTPTVVDTRTGQPIDPAANAAPVVLTSGTPTVCTVSGTTVTAVHAGICIINGVQMASANYQAATAASDTAGTTESVQITVLAAAQSLSVVADDLTVAVGDQITPTVQISGLFDGDSISGVDYDYYSGTTLLNTAPTTPGTYRVVPRGGALQAADSGAYTNPTSFAYVAGSLVITALPPVITTVASAIGPITGGNRVTVTGTRLDTVGSVRIGDTTLRRGSFTVNPDGTELTFTAPAVGDPGAVDLTLVAGAATATEVYTYVTPDVVPTAPGAPAWVSATAGNGQMTVTFTPPAAIDTAPVTAYQLSFDDGRTWRTVATAAAGQHRTVTVTGLSNGVTYPVRVRAVNRIGAGTASTVRDVMPNAPALPPVTHPATQIPVPASPDAYKGQQKFTRALDTSAAGIGAHLIPQLGARQLVRGEAATLSRKGLFEFDSAVLTTAGRAEVRALATHLRAAKSVTCEGYTDYAGEKAHELTLSLQRATAVCKALVQYGANVHIAYRGYGGARPVIVGGTAESREANRRVVVVVTG